MASYHCTATIGGAGASAAHADYIGRDGKHKKKPGDDDLESAGHGNLPAWAEDAPRSFWQAADEYERVNGSTYRELVVALPRELTPLQRCELVEDFIRQELGDKHAFQWGIHKPKASLEGGEQPHAHIMYSERILDGIDRPREQFFKRYNGKNPERGGCKKASGGKTKDENVAALLVTRERWARVQNEHLARYEHSARVDHRSLKDQGIDREPERHLGQAQIQTQSVAVERVLAARVDRRLTSVLEAAIAGAARRLARLQAVAAATVARVRKASQRSHNVPGSASTESQAIPQSQSLADMAEFLRVLGQESGTVVQEARGLAERSRTQLERERAREAHLRERIEGMTPPGLLSTKATKQGFEKQVRELRAQGQAAVDAQTVAHKGLEKARDTEASPQDVALERIKAQDPGLVERMAPLLKDAQLVNAAKRHLEQQRAAEIAASRARLERQMAEKKALERDRGRGR